MPEPSLYEHASLDTLHNRLHVRGTLLAQTALRIGAGRASDVVGNDLPVLRDGRNRPFIPGASLKGAFRARLEGLIRAVAPAQVLDFEAIEQRTKEAVRLLKEETESDALLSQKLWQASTMIDLTFGSPELAGRIFFRDASVDEKFWFETFEVRNGVAINRDTETVEGSLLYDYEVVPAGTRFGFALTLEQAADWQLGMVLLALQAWQSEAGVQIGGFRSRGLGYIQLVEPTYRYQQVQPKEVDSALRMICDAETLAALGIAPADETIDAHKQAWISAFRTQLGVLAQQGATNA